MMFTHSHKNNHNKETYKIPASKENKCLLFGTSVPMGQIIYTDESRIIKKCASLNHNSLFKNILPLSER